MLPAGVGAGGLQLPTDFSTRRPRSLSFETIGTGTNPKKCKLNTGPIHDMAFNLLVDAYY